MLRAIGFGLLATLGMAVVYGVAWGVIALSWGLLAVGVGGGWLVGAAVREGVRRSAAEQPSDGRPSVGLAPLLAAILGAGAWLIGSYIAYALVQVAEGGVGLLDPGRFVSHVAAALQLEPTWLQPAVLLAFVVVAGFTARR